MMIYLQFKHKSVFIHSLMCHVIKEIWATFQCLKLKPKVGKSSFHFRITKGTKIINNYIQKVNLKNTLKEHKTQLIKS